MYHNFEALWSKDSKYLYGGAFKPKTHKFRILWGLPSSGEFYNQKLYLPSFDGLNELPPGVLGDTWVRDAGLLRFVSILSGLPPPPLLIGIICNRKKKIFSKT